MSSYQDLFARSQQAPEQFWQEQAAQIHWFEQPTEVLARDEEDLPRWFRGGKLNTAWLALDFHVLNGHGTRPALIYDSPVTGTQRTFSYAELLDEVARFAGVLQQFNVAKGDRVVIYMPMIPETVIAMLACARIGAIHSVVFGGFAPHELAVRIDDTQPKVLVAANAGREVTRVVDYLEIIDAALDEAEHRPEACIVYQRDFHQARLRDGRDWDWQQLIEAAQPAQCVTVDATDPLYILYTSGTTGRPKGILRDNGGHAVAMKFSMEKIYGVQPGDVFWAASDVGWVVGHTCIVYGPLIHGCTTVLYEGKPVRTPDAGAFWRVVHDHQVQSMFAAPTALRAIKREDPDGKLYHPPDTSSLQYLFLAGERCDVATLQWARQLLNIPVIDHWWQTESGWPMLANMAGVELLPVKPGSAGKPVCGYDICVLNEYGRQLPADTEGLIAVRLPLPPGCLPNLWRNTPRFRAAYLDQYPGYYVSGDSGYRDADGYFYVTGRIDDVINVAGHRLSTATLEEVVASHPAVAECTVIGVEDELKGQVPVALVVLKANSDAEPRQVELEIVGKVRHQVGPVASLKRVLLVRRLPKTRSGKILRRTVRDIFDGKPFQRPSTIEDPEVLDELVALRQQPVHRSDSAPPPRGATP